MTSSNVPNARIITIKAVFRSSLGKSSYASSAAKDQRTFKNASNAKRLLLFRKPKNVQNANCLIIEGAGSVQTISAKNAVN